MAGDSHVQVNHETPSISQAEDDKTRIVKFPITATNPPALHPQQVNELFQPSKDGPDHIQSFVRIFTELYLDGKRGEDFTKGAAETISAQMFTSSVLQSLAGIYRSVRKALMQDAENCSPVLLMDPSNCPV